MTVLLQIGGPYIILYRYSLYHSPSTYFPSTTQCRLLLRPLSLTSLANASSHSQLFSKFLTRSQGFLLGYDCPLYLTTRLIYNILLVILPVWELPRDQGSVDWLEISILYGWKGGPIHGHFGQLLCCPKHSYGHFP